MNTKERLQTLFESVFPDVPAEEIPQATQNNTQNWDSVAAITLMNVIEEEFEIQMDFEDLGDLTSFSKILDYLNERVSPATAKIS
jgi:acyl carrier protein